MPQARWQFLNFSGAGHLRTAVGQLGARQQHRHLMLQPSISSPRPRSNRRTGLREPEEILGDDAGRHLRKASMRRHAGISQLLRRIALTDEARRVTISSDPALDFKILILWIAYDGSLQHSDV